MPKLLSSSLLVAMTAMMAISASARAAQYSIEPILSPTAGDVYPTSISSAGLVVGWTNSASGTLQSCFKYKNGVVTILPLPPQTSHCLHASTDLQGNITMTVAALENTSISRVFELSNKGAFRQLQGLSADGNAAFSSAGGRMAGYSTGPSGQEQAYIFNRTGGGINVGALTGYPSSRLVSINVQGVAVGNVYDAAAGVDRAFKYSLGSITWLEPLSTAGAFAQGVSPTGVVVGQSREAPSGFGTDRATAWQGKKAPTNFGSFGGQATFAYSMNRAGDIVGAYGMGSGGLRIRNASLEALRDLVSPADMVPWGSFLGQGLAISEAGLIAGGGFSSRFNGQKAGYLLRPLP